MRFSEVFYPVAFVILLAWLVQSGVIHVEHAGGPLADPSDTPNLPSVSATTRPPQHLATAKINEQGFWIFVAGNPDVWSVAVSEDD